MGAIAVHHTATENSSWDGPGAVAAMPGDSSVLHYCHAWVNSDRDPDAKGSYKFPHHRTKGGPANLPACRNGLARLSSANVPDSDRAGIEAHLRAHLNDADQNDLMEQSLTARFKTARPLAALRQGRNDWYRIENRTDSGVVQVAIYDEIGYFGVTAKDFLGDLKAVRGDSIEVHLNTPGGEVFDGIAIYNALRNHPAEVTVIVDSLAASIGSVIAMAGDRIVMTRNSQMMIHDGHGMCVGNAADMRNLADLLDKTSDNIASIYAERTGTSTKTWRNVMRAEKWYSAEEAVSAGLADEVQGMSNVANTWDLSIYGRSAHAAGLVEDVPDFDVSAITDALRGAFSD